MLPLLVQAQDSTATRFQSLTLTADLGAATVQFMDEYRSMYAFAADLQINKKTYGGLVAGWQKLDKSNEVFDYTSSGVFVKADVKYDFLNKKDSDKTSIAYISGRVAFSSFNQDATNIVLRNTYWGEKHFELQKQSLNAIWLELGGGIRADMFRHFMLGWNLHIRVMAKKPDYYLIPPDNIPGFGKGDETVVFGFEYTLSFRIPFAK